MRLAAFIIVSLMASAPTLGAEQTAQTPEQAKQQLLAAQGAIDEVQAWLVKANAQQSNEEKRLQNAVVALSNSTRGLEGLAEQRRSLEVKLDELQRLIAGQKSTLVAREQELGDVMRALYRQGDMSLARAFLSGQGPTNATRQLNYLSSIAATQRATLASYKQALDGRTKSQLQIGSQRQKLVRVEARSAAAQEKRAAETQERQAALAGLTNSIKTQRGELEQLEMDKAGIQQLVEQLELAMRKIPVPEAGTHFALMKGKLSAPVKASIYARFGTDSNGVSRQGLTFDANGSEAVLAVHSGRVVFADWLRGAGLLVIVDHGDSYMTLYGNNESLKVTAGVSIEAGDVVANAGRGAGEDAGLHFEIRKGGIALDPEAWLSK